MLRDQPGIAGRPDGAVRRLDPEAAGVLVLEDAIAGAGDAFCQAWSAGVTVHPDRSDVEPFPDAVAVAGKPSLVHQRGRRSRVEWYAVVTAARSRQVGTL